MRVPHETYNHVYKNTVDDTYGYVLKSGPFPCEAQGFSNGKQAAKHMTDYVRKNMGIESSSRFNADSRKKYSGH